MKLHIGSEDIDFHQLIENSINSIWIITQEGKIVYCNKACLNLFKLASFEEMINKCAWDYLHPSFHEKSKLRLKKILKDKEVLERIEVKMLKSNGEIFDVEVITAPIYSENQDLVQVCMLDITVRKATEKLLKDREKLASVGQIAAGIAHEVKNPLTSVKGFLQLVKESKPHPYLDIMEDELTKALNTLQNLLQVSKPDLHDEPLSSIDLCKEITSTISLFQERLYFIDVSLDLRDSEKKIIGKKNLFQRALFNLIKNAVEAIENRGLISVEHFYKDGSIHIKISDTGIGIPNEKIEMLGTPFYSTKNKGTGLGLTQVFTTVHEHYGNISIQSEEGKGTTFHIQLPVKEED